MARDGLALGRIPTDVKLIDFPNLAVVFFLGIAPTTVAVKLFRVKAMRPTKPAARYAVAILATAVALFARQLLTPLYGSQNPYHTVWLAIAFSAWYCGLGPSIVTALLGSLGVWYWFIPPLHSFAMHNRSDLFGALGFMVFSSAIIALGESNRRGYVARSRLAAIVQSSDDAIISKDLDAGFGRTV